MSQATITLLVAIATLAQVSGASETLPQQIDHCELTERPERYDGAVVNVRSRLFESRQGEWVISGYCFRDVLIALRSSATSLPEIDPFRAPFLDELSALHRQGGFIEANFIGRVDWSGARPRSDLEWLGTGPFGRSKATMRLVLRDERDIRRIPVLRR